MLSDSVRPTAENALDAAVTVLREATEALEMVDTSKLDAAVDRACALIDQLRVEKADLIAALRRHLPYLEDMLAPCEDDCECPLHDFRALIAKAEHGGEQ